MSPSKLNSLLTGLFFAIIVALGGSVMAQDGLRLFRPYTVESFGGGRRGNDGVYGSVSGIYWSISAPTGGYIGATTTKGDDEKRWVWDADTFALQTNSIKVDMMSPKTSLGTRFEVGNRRGHYGWFVSGYGLPDQTHRMNVQRASITIRDEGDFNYRLTDSNLSLATTGLLFVWGGNSTNPPDWQQVDPETGGVSGGPSAVTGLGYMWGYFSYVAADDGTVGFFAPLPILFEHVDLNVRSSHCSGELMYTYRPHPFTWGSMELLAGARYWEFKDGFWLSGFSGDGVPVPDTPGILPQSALRAMLVDAEGMNRIFGPQFGIKLNRHNARWSFGAEGRLTAGINAQVLKTRGNITPRTTSFTGPEPSGQWGPLGLQSNNTNFGHKKNKTVFSPIGELRLTADWQWTNAISFFGALDGMFAGNVARGVRVTDYVVQSDGTIFGIRGNDRNETIFVYGVELGIKMNR